MAIYAVFRALGLGIEILPVMRLPVRYKSRQLRFGGVTLNYRSEQLPFVKRLERLKNRQWSGRRGADVAPKPTVDDIRLDYKGYDSDDGLNNEGNPEVTDHEDYKDVHTRLQTILKTRQIRDISTAPEPVMTGTKLHERVQDTDMGDEYTIDVCLPDHSVCKQAEENSRYMCPHRRETKHGPM